MKTILTKPSGIKLYQDNDGIYFLIFPHLTRTAVDDAYEILHNLDLEYAQNGEHIRMVYDLRQSSWLTPYAISKMIQVGKETPQNLHQTLAILLKDFVAVRMIEGSMKLLPQRIIKDVQIFTNETKAVEWVRSTE